MNHSSQIEKKPWCFGMSLVTLLLISGCASDRPYQAWIERDADWAADAEALAATGARGEVASQDSPALTLSDDAGAEEYVRIALRRNPAIERDRQKVAARLERIPQVTSLDDPEFTISPIGEKAETAAGQVGLTTGLSQKLPFPGKLDTRGRIAFQEAAAARAELAQTRLDVAARTRTAYWNYFQSVRVIEVVKENRSILKQFRDVASAQYEAGTSPQQDVLRATTQLGELRKQLLTLRKRRTAAQARLNALLDRRADASLPTPQDAKLHPIALSLSRLVGLANETNPKAARVRAEIAEAKQRLDLAELQRWPDLTVGVNYNAVDDEGLAPAANGKDQWFVTFGINLPIWVDKLDAVENEAHRELLSSLADLRRTRNTYQARLRDLLAEVDTQQELVVLFRDELIPQARQTLDASLSAYRSGDGEFLNIVESWEKLLRYQRMYYQSLAGFEQAFAELEKTVGQKVPRQ